MHRHASCIAFGGRGILLLGKSGAGKSSLTLRAIAAGAMLVADDQVILQAEGSALYATAPDNLRGLIEMRGVGIISQPYRRRVPVELAVQLVADKDVPRLPDPQTQAWLEITVPLYHLHAFDSAAPLKLQMLLAEIT